jgi:KDO2-lipid IV(A) lauroyltransferase
MVAEIFERGIGEHPADWHMLQPLWRADLDDRRTGSTAAAAAEPVGQGQSR